MNTNFANKKLILAGGILVSFFATASLVFAVYVCPADNSNWPELGDCNLFCKTHPIAPQACVEEAFNQHKECKNGDCIIVQGPGVDLCQSNATCRQKVCEGQSCVLELAPGPGGMGPDRCQTNANCVYSPPPRGPRDPKEGESVPAGSTQPQPPAGGTGAEVPNPLGVKTFQELVERIAWYLFQIGIPIAVIMILYAAFLYMTAAGSQEKVSKAHKALTYALVGLAILFLAYGLASLIAELLGKQ
jgi:hypothetical protein